MTLHNPVRTIDRHNVVALLKGTTPPEQVVVYTAHWDHFGEKPGADGKTQIFHGAVDNGSGIAGLMELARASPRQAGAGAQRAVHRHHLRGTGPAGLGLLRRASAVSAARTRSPTSTWM